MAKKKETKKKETKKKETKEIKKAIKKPVKVEKLTDSDFIGSGSYLLDLALSERRDGGYLLGSVVHISAKNHVGKSFLGLNCFAEAKGNKDLEKYKLILDEPEAANNFPMDELFGKGMKKRITFLPENREIARTVQDWHDDITNLNNHPYVYILDSFDALTSVDELKQKEAPTKGGYHTEKASVSSSTFPKIVGPIKQHKSLFIMISQTRKNLGMGMEEETTSGGNAKDFYRSIYIQMKKVRTLHKEVRGKKIVVGSLVKFIIKKNKITGKIREVEVPIYTDYGMDDIESMVNWIMTHKFWEGGSWIDTCGDFIKGDDETKKWQKKELIAYIEENGLEQKLKDIVYECWMQYEEEICTTRKKRYV